MSNEWTPEKEMAAQKWLDGQKAKDPMFDKRLEFGNLLMRHADTLTPVERARYAELSEEIQKHDFPNS